MTEPARPARRPLSPHLQVYRPQITSVLSILHRITGFALAGGALLAAWWLASVALGAEAYAVFYAVWKSAPGQVLLALWVWALAYHLLNGLRHLVWDTGRGFNMGSVARSGWAVVAGSALLAAWLWFSLSA